MNETRPARVACVQRQSEAPARWHASFRRGGATGALEACRAMAESAARRDGVPAQSPARGARLVSAPACAPSPGPSSASSSEVYTKEAAPKFIQLSKGTVCGVLMSEADALQEVVGTGEAPPFKRWQMSPPVCECVPYPAARWCRAARR